MLVRLKHLNCLHFRELFLFENILNQQSQTRRCALCAGYRGVVHTAKLALTLIYVAVGLYDTQSFEWPFLLPTKVPMYKKVKQFVFLVQSIVL